MINLKTLKDQIDQVEKIKGTLEGFYLMLSSLEGVKGGGITKKRKTRADAGKPRGPRGKKSGKKPINMAVKKSIEESQKLAQPGLKTTHFK